jgi:hypothetical protein
VATGDVPGPGILWYYVCCGKHVDSSAILPTLLVDYEMKRNRSAYAKQNRAIRLKHGLCSRCGKRKVVPETTKCEVCSEYMRWYAKERRDNKPAGICKRLSCNNKAIIGNTECLEHKKLAAQYQLTYKRNKKLQQEKILDAINRQIYYNGS